MQKRYSLSIGGTEIVITPPPEFDLVVANQFYGCFLKEEGFVTPGEISVDMVFGQIPDTRELTTLLGGDDSWSMFRDGDDYVMRFYRRDSGKPRMAARFDPAVKTVGLICTDDIIRNGSSAWNPVPGPLDQVLLMYHLSLKSGVIVHSAGIDFDGTGYVFAGRSGAGKTTISRKLTAKSGSEGLSDDRVIVRKIGDSFRMFGTPWPGEAGMAVNKSVPLRAVFFLVQSMENRVEKITRTEAFRRFMPVLSIPWFDQDAINRYFSIVEKLISEVPSYVLYFNPEIRIEDIFEEFARV